jgi:putative flippase GtrA
MGTGGSAAKYTVVGAIGTGVKVGALVLLHDTCGLGALAATALAVELSTLHNFAWHMGWTWRDRSRGLGAREIAARLLRFHLGNGAVALAVNMICVPLLTGAGFSYAVAGVLATIAGGVVNFAVAGLWVFTRRAPAPAAVPRDACRGPATI